ncbi:hypothetical protein ACFL6X_04235 [Candidatus Latescibacterota bacterium]
MQKVTREELTRAARVYKTNMAACQALSISANTFARLCREYGIETPRERRLRNKA